MERPLRISARFEHEVNKKIEEHTKRGYKLKDRGVSRDGRGYVERVKYWAVMVKEEAPGA